MEKENAQEKKTRVSRTMTVCYGYEVDANGCLRPRLGEADVVFYIYNSFLAGQSMGQIAASLSRMGVPSPSGKAVWNRATVANILGNEKYAGDVLLWRRSRGEGQQVPTVDRKPVLLRDHHPALIPRQVFEEAQEERRRRSQRRRQKSSP